MLNFTTNITNYTTSARTSNSAFTAYTSKKQLLNANILSAKQAQFVASIKNCFTFAVHNSLQYVAVTMYYANTKTYGFIVLDLNTLAIGEGATSIAQAKQEILELVKAQEAQQ